MKFYEEVNYLKNVSKKNSFSSSLVDKCIKIFLNKQFSQKKFEHTVPKEELIIYSFIISWYVFPMFENTLTIKHQQQHFIL